MGLKVIDSTGALKTSLPDNYLLNTGDVGTGTYDFGGADDLEIPNGAAPTVDTAGQIAIDTTITNHTGLLTYHDGSEALYAVGLPTGNLGSTDGNVIAYNATNDEFEMVAQSGGGGNFVQMQYATTTTSGSGTTTIPYDDTIPQNTEGSEMMTVSITPDDATNLLIIDAFVPDCVASTGVNTIFALFQDSTADALQATATNIALNTAYPSSMVLRHIMVAGTTSSTTFKLRYGPSSAATMYFLRSVSADKLSTANIAVLSVTEVVA